MVQGRTKGGQKGNQEHQANVPSPPVTTTLVTLHRHGGTTAPLPWDAAITACCRAADRREEGQAAALAPSKCPDLGGHTHPLLDLYVHCQLNPLRSRSPQAREATGEERGHGSASQPALPAPRGQKAVTSSSTAPVKKTNIPRFY